MLAFLDQQPDYDAIKGKQNAAWSSGSYSKIGVTLQITGEELAEATNLPPGSTVLDVAAGNGNTSLAFARRFAAVTSTDYVASLLDDGKRRSAAEDLDLTFEVADAEDLPFDHDTFDAVTSSFGVMFTPNQKQSASELLRVCRSGGKIALANWTPRSFIGTLFKTLGKHVPPPAGVKSPGLWGDQDWLAETFGAQSKDISIVLKNFNFRYHSPAHFVDFFSEWYGPVHKAFVAVGENGAAALKDDIIATIDAFNVATDGSMIVPSEYAEVIITKS